MALHGLGRLSEAENEARLALGTYPNSAQCHLVLGSILAARGHRDLTVLAHFERASLNYPRALLLAAIVYDERGQRAEAEEVLRRCLRSRTPGSGSHAACREQLRRFGTGGLVSGRPNLLEREATQ